MIAREGYGHLGNLFHAENCLFARDDVLLRSRYREDATLSTGEDGVELGYAEHAHVRDCERARVVLVRLESSGLGLIDKSLSTK
jgi:hypothetical protein